MYSKDLIFEKIQKTLIKEFNIDKSLIEETSDFQTDLKMDSLDTIEFIMHLEEEFDIYIENKTLSTIHRINDLIDYIYKQKNKKIQQNGLIN